MTKVRVMINATMASNISIVPRTSKLWIYCFNSISICWTSSLPGDSGLPLGSIPEPLFFFSNSVMQSVPAGTNINFAKRVAPTWFAIKENMMKAAQRLFRRLPGSFLNLVATPSNYNVTVWYSFMQQKQRVRLSFCSVPHILSRMKPMRVSCCAIMKIWIGTKMKVLTVVHTDNMANRSTISLVETI